MQMGDDKSRLWGELKDALEAWGEGRHPSLIDEVTRITWVNFQRDRACTFLDGADVDGPRAYVERVAEHYQRWSPYLHYLQVEKDAAAWTELLEKFQLWSYNLLGRMSFPANAVRYRLSVDLATDAAAEILTSHFPYDVEFDRWAYVLVRNVVYSAMRDRLNGSRVPEEQLVNLEAWDGWLRNVADERAEARIYEAAEREAREMGHDRLLAAVGELPPSEREVIRLYYFADLGFDEIAERTSKTPNALYQYHFRALKKLREALNGVHFPM